MRRQRSLLLRLGRRHMRVEGQKASTNYCPRQAHRRQKCATLPNIRGTAQPSVARSVTENSASSGTTPGGPPSVQRGALTASRHARKATAGGYADFKPPDNGCGLLRIGRRHMRFILVNGRSPRPRSLCVMCDQPVGASYLREIGTLLVYCDHNCYAAYCKSAVPLPENQARAS